MYDDLIIMRDIKIWCCPFCGNQNSEFPSQEREEAVFVECPICGRYVINLDDLKKLEPIKDKIAGILYHTKKHTEKSDTRIIGDETFYDENKKFSRPKYISLDLIDNLYPSRFSTKIEYILLGIARKSEFFGNSAEYSFDEFCSAFFIRRFNADGTKMDLPKINLQIHKIISYLKDKNVDYAAISESINSKFPVHVSLNPNGWQRIEALEIADKNNKNAFIAMAFGEKTKATREALKSGIINAGYNPILIDEVTHNHQIVPEMFKKIRDSKFLVIDISVPNTGAYYEAGYAYGRGKEVIFCCNEESFDSQDKEMRPHFDVSQKQMIRWKDESDLTMQLTQWIKSLFE